MTQLLRSKSQLRNGLAKRNRTDRQVGANMRMKYVEQERIRLESMVHKRTEEVSKLTEALRAETYGRILAEEARSQLASMVECSEDAIVGKTLDGVVTSWNSSAERMFGYTGDEVIGRSITIIFPPELLHEEKDILKRVREWGAVENYETVRVRKDGRRLDVSITVSPIRDTSGEVIGLFSIKRNITRLKEIEATLNAYMARLEQSNQALQEFASTASHDLQEPLRKIKLFSDRLQAGYDNVLDSTGKDYLERIQCSTERMHRLIADLLSYSQVTTQARSLGRIDLEVLVREVLSDLEARIEESDACVEVRNLPTIRADANQMRELFQNLVGNALKYRRKERPRILISGYIGQDGHCRIEIQDNGIGFDEKHKDRIFMLFERLHGRNQYEGTGIGLAICKKIVERHGGTITARSFPGKGSTFMLTLPLDQVESATG